MQFFLKLVPSRPTFVKDASESERAVMREHAVYWMGYKKKGIMLAFGLVLDPKGPYGAGIMEAPDEAFVRKLIADDPAVKARLGVYEICPVGGAG